MFDSPENFAGLASFLGPVGGRVALTILVLVGALLLRWVAERAIRRRFGEARTRGEGGLSEAGLDDRHGAYRLRKISRYLVWALAGLLLVLVWTEFGRRLGIAVGLFSAGLAFALQNVLGSFAAWIGILAGRVFRVEDRVMMGGVRGDVISRPYGPRSWR